MIHTVLLIEDNPSDILLIQRAFQLAAFPQVSLQILQDGDTAIAYLRGEREFSNRDRYPLPALLLLDWNLPRRSGPEVLRWLKQQPGLKRLPVVMLSSSREQANINQAYDLGANSYLTKPGGIEALSELLRTIHAYWLRYSEQPALYE
ncbi:MAG TPA: response regulator [Crinalium sp.]|jgi:CheY-like chemotaxis protein